MTGPRGYYRFPWSWSAAEIVARLAGSSSYRQIARTLRERRIVERRPDPATVRRAVLRLEREVAHGA